MLNLKDESMKVEWSVLTAIISAIAALAGVFISNKANEKRIKLAI